MVQDKNVIKSFNIQSYLKLDILSDNLKYSNKLKTIKADVNLSEEKYF